MRRALKLTVQVQKASEELGIIWGYASVADLLDDQGDVVPQEELVKAVYQFMEDYYSGQAVIKENHEKAAKATLVESTFHFIGTHLAWFVGVKLHDPGLREAAVKGEISGFSIGGWYQPEEEGANG